MSVNYFFAGAAGNAEDELLIRLNANKLLSYKTERTYINKFIEYKKAGWTGMLLIDNGAFTVHRKGGTIDIDEYINWINDNIDWIDYAIALDHIPGKWGTPRSIEDIKFSADITYNNYIYMLKKVTNPAKIIPVFHYGESLDNLKRFLDIDDLNFLCISGAKGDSMNKFKKWLSDCFSLIKSCGKNHIKIHILGCGDLEMGNYFNIYSMDSTTYIMTAATGSILTPRGIVYVGNNSVMSKLENDEKEYLENYLKNLNLSIDDCINSRKFRIFANIYYMLNKSKQINYIESNINKRKLF